MGTMKRLALYLRRWPHGRHVKGGSKMRRHGTRRVDPDIMDAMDMQCTKSLLITLLPRALIYVYVLLSALSNISRHLTP